VVNLVGNHLLNIMQDGQIRARSVIPERQQTLHDRW
jgi:hypothetical protein